MLDPLAMAMRIRRHGLTLGDRAARIDFAENILNGVAESFALPPHNDSGVSALHDGDLH